MAPTEATTGAFQAAGDVPARPLLLAVDAAAALVMLAACFLAVVASDTNSTYAESLWYALPALFGVIAFALGWARRKAGHVVWREALLQAAHWLGVLAALRTVFFLVSVNQFTDASAGIACGVVVALGAFLSGVHGQWRLAPVGLAMLAATATVALVEENMWVLLGIALIGFAAVIAVGRLQAKFGAAASSQAD